MRVSCRTPQRVCHTVFESAGLRKHPTVALLPFTQRSIFNDCHLSNTLPGQHGAFYRSSDLHAGVVDPSCQRDDPTPKSPTAEGGITRWIMPSSRVPMTSSVN